MLSRASTWFQILTVITGPDIVDSIGGSSGHISGRKPGILDITDILI